MLKGGGDYFKIPLTRVRTLLPMSVVVDKPWVHRGLHTREHDLDQVSFMDVVCRGQPLEDVLVIQVVAKEQDLVVHAKEAALWELQREAGVKVIGGKTLEMLQV